eukprot:431961_1
MAILYLQNILTLVQNSNSVQDLIPILLSFPIAEVKQFICASLNTEFNSNDICSLCAHDCVFVGRNEAESGIKASCYAQKVTVTESVFTQCGNANNEECGRRMDGECSCVHVSVPYDIEYTVQQRGSPSIELNCVSNVFRDNKGYPVAVKLEAYCSGDEVEAREIDLDLTVFECVLEQNELNGYNGIYTHQQNIDANVLYLNQI